MCLGTGPVIYTGWKSFSWVWGCSYRKSLLLNYAWILCVLPMLSQSDRHRNPRHKQCLFKGRRTKYRTDCLRIHWSRRNSHWRYYRRLTDKLTGGVALDVLGHIHPGNDHINCRHSHRAASGQIVSQNAYRLHGSRDFYCWYMSPCLRAQ